MIFGAAAHAGLAGADRGAMSRPTTPPRPVTPRDLAVLVAERIIALSR